MQALKQTFNFTIALLLVICVTLAFSNAAGILSHALAVSGEKIWGTPLQDMKMNLVTDTTPIPEGQWSYIVRKQAVDEAQISITTWNALTQGDMNQMKRDIESQVLGSRVTWIRISWRNAYLVILPNGMNIVYLSGFQIEAIVENVGSSSALYSDNGGYQLVHSVKPVILWTPAMVLAVISAVVWLVALIAIIVWGTWLLWLVTSAVAKLPEFLQPWVMIIIGLLLLVGLGFLLYIILGGKVNYSDKKRGLKLGRLLHFSFGG